MGAPSTERLPSPDLSVDEVRECPDELTRARLVYAEGAGYLAFWAHSGWYSMPSDFISASFSPHAAFCLSRPRRSVIFSHSAKAVSSASLADLRLASASVISNDSLRWYSSAAGTTGSGTRKGKAASMASRYLSASGKALRKMGERRCESRHGSMIVLGSITILRL